MENMWWRQWSINILRPIHYDMQGVTEIHENIISWKFESYDI